MSIPSSKPDFDTRIYRRGRASVKWDLKPWTHDGRDILPMWVADMDFAIPQVVEEALRERLAHPVFGYTLFSDADREAYVGWQHRRNRWDIEPDWLLFVPGVMPAVRAAILALSEPGDEVVIQPPVYYPFFDAVTDNARTLVANPLVAAGDGYAMDLDHLEAVVSPRTRLLLLCSPHNPVGRVWTRDELSGLAAVCARHGITVISDEIHSDLIRTGHTFVPFASIAPEVANSTVTCVSPTKTFNLAGVASGTVIARDPERRSAVSASLHRLGMELPNALSLAAATAAYDRGDAWVDHLLDYLTGTFTWFEVEMAQRFPQIGVTRIEGTYLAWLDLRAVMTTAGVKERVITHALLQVGGLWLSEGARFGAPGRGFWRMNLACPRDVIREALDRLEQALESLA